uniref:Zinc finger protein n=1 Tax=Tanacetum cinerariifolium TaxID=118510 RepID=A0A699I1E9_TANCI|nr:zinc finger protein [Tanacetum cinerariifolium]
MSVPYNMSGGMESSSRYGELHRASAVVRISFSSSKSFFLRKALTELLTKSQNLRLITAPLMKVNVGDISARSRISDLEKLSVSNIRTEIIGDIGRDFAEILILDLGDGLLWSDVREAMRGNVDIRPSTRSKRERYRDDDDEISVGGGLEEEVNALDDVDSDAEPLDCN